ncbi:MAG: U32 family peptidase [Fusobacteriaceae bacterium]|jgi:putative protease|nr:U32 family peptidase [Fusobacteriaceae bacterium]
MKIVAPAGNMERFYSAVKAGADEIYMGLKGFGARRNAGNFTVDEFINSLDYAHQRGVKLLLTLNTLMTCNEMDFLYPNLKSLYEHGLDGIIIQDFGLFKFLKNNFSDIDIHASTQMGIGTHKEINFLKSIGFNRVILPRELSFDEIKNIKENTDIELEVFVSGALCICYSGKCYMSSFIGGRSGNRGLCAQPCRKKYMDENNDSGFFLSPKDQLLGIHEINKLKDIGIDNIKIEGRMKDPNYVFEVVDYYKKIINGTPRKENVSEIFNRGYEIPYFYENNKNIINKNYSSNIGKEIGKLITNKIYLTNDIQLGDGIIFLDRDYNILEGTFVNKIIICSNGKNIESSSAKSGDVVFLKKIPPKCEFIYKNYSKYMNDKISNELKIEKKIPIHIEIHAKLNQFPKIIFKCNNAYNREISFEYTGNNILEKAKSTPTSSIDLLSKINELGNTNFYSEQVTCDIDENIFFPISILKAMKRICSEGLNVKLMESYYRKSVEKINFNQNECYKKKNGKNILISVIASNEEQIKTVKRFGIKKIYQATNNIILEKNIKKPLIKSAIVYNLYELLENKSENLTLHWTFNIINRLSIEMLADNFKNIDTIIISPEISFAKIKEIGSTSIKKAILIYSKLKAMTMESDIFNKTDKKIRNEEGDEFSVLRNPMGNTEIYFDKPLNIINDKNLNDLDINEYVLEFSNETPEEIIEILSLLDKSFISPYYYNYQRGVF